MSAPGALVLVVGPSGSGKDTLIGAAQTALGGDERFAFQRRVVTRHAVAGLEDHQSVGRAEFEAMQQRGDFALSWEAHGLRYGVPASIDAAIAAGRIVVCNGSRQIIGAARQGYRRCFVLLVTADRAVRATRLARRGRETEMEIAARLEREGALVPAGVQPAVIDNSGSLAVGATAILVALLNIAAGEPPAA